MEFKARITSITNDIFTKDLILIFQTADRNILSAINDYQNTDINLKMSKFKKRRSLDSNAYLWVLCAKIAQVLETSKDEVYKDMILKYGTVAETKNGHIVISLLSNIDVSMLQGHWKYLKTSSDGKFKSYIMLKGSSEFDNIEMSLFLHCVVEEAKELGIEVISEEEIKEMNERWGI